jgi:hypothetical protein
MNRNASQRSNESSTNISAQVHSHAPTFAKVLDGRKQPVRGLWQRGARFYAQLTPLTAQDKRDPWPGDFTNFVIQRRQAWPQAAFRSHVHSRGGGVRVNRKLDCVSLNVGVVVRLQARPQLPCFTASLSATTLFP